jgi:hypothetical protein
MWIFAKFYVMVFGMKTNIEQPVLFETEEDWRKEWQDMPEFIQEDEMPFRTIYVHFKSQSDINNFAKLMQQQITGETKSLWFPKAIIGGYFNKRYVDES